MGKRLRVGVVCDLASEGWPSMDLVADMLVRHLAAHDAGAIEAVPLRPELGRPHVWSGPRPPLSLASARRMVDRYWRYPGWLGRMAAGFDVFHVVDHSYAHLVHVLPAERTVVTCHDVDAFRALFDPACRESRLPLMVVRRVLEGLRRAAVVACASEATRNELVERGGIDAARTLVVPNGIDLGKYPAPQPAGRQSLGIRQECRLATFVGRLAPQKGVQWLIQ
ncbi:MAG: hypothetical protein EHM24_27130, partial [Acidobacteria bacterium]